MSNNIKKILMAGTALIAIASATQAYADTLFVNGGVLGVSSDPDATPAIVFLTPDWASIDDGVDVTGTITTTADNQGNLAVQGTTTISGDVGEAGKQLNLTWSGIAGGTTATFNGHVYAKTIYAGAGTTIFNGGATADLIQFSDAGTIDVNSTIISDIDIGGGVAVVNFSDGGAITGGVSDMAGADRGTVNFAGSSTVGSIGTAGAVNIVNLNNAAGKTVTFNGDVLTANGVNIKNTGTAEFKGTLTGEVTFSSNGTANLMWGNDLNGSVHSSGGHFGSLILAGDDNNDFELNGDLGAGGVLKVITLNGSNNTLLLGGDFSAADTTTLGNNHIRVSSVTIGAGQTLNVDFGNKTSGQIYSSGDAIVNKGSIIQPHATSYLAVNDQITIIDGSNDGDGHVATLDAGMLKNTAVLTFAQVADTSSLIVKVSARNNLADVATTTSGISISNVLDQVAGGGNAALQSVQLSLDNAANAAAVNNILATLAPDVTGRVVNASLFESERVQGITNDRIAALRSGDNDMSGMAAGASFNGTSMWLQGYGQTAQQDMRGGIAGYNSGTLGTAAGVDSTRLIRDGVLGIALNYGKTNANSKNATTTGTDVDTYGVNIYASHDLDRDTFLNGQIGYAYNQINSDRHNVGGPGLTANADYHSDQYSARLAVGHDYMTHQAGLIMTPSASAAYTNLRTSGYTETGTGGGLNVASETFNVLKLGVGVDANWCFKNALGARLKPVLHAGYTYNAINDRIETTASFIGGGGSFVTTGASPVRSAFDAGAGVTYMSTANWDLSANYDYIYKTDYTSHAGILRATSHF